MFVMVEKNDELKLTRSFMFVTRSSHVDGGSLFRELCRATRVGAQWPSLLEGTDEGNPKISKA